jgi:lactate 2-monooxygenase
MALGANAVLVGRPYVYALAVGGEPGVAALIEQLAAETDLTLALLGAGSIAEVDSSWIAASS